jgi:hypothetical protein
VSQTKNCLSLSFIRCAWTGFEKQDSTIRVLGVELVLGNQGWILYLPSYRRRSAHRKAGRYPEHRFGWHCCWIPACAGMTNSNVLVMYFDIAIIFQCLDGNTSRLFHFSLGLAFQSHDIKPTKSVQILGRLSLLTFFGEAKKVSASRHERDSF